MPILSILASLALLVCLSVNGNGQRNRLCPPTPRNMSGLFINECNKLLSREGIAGDCPSIWSTFASAFARKDPGAVTADDYLPYFQLLPGLTRNLNTSLFWSRTPALVALLSCMCATGANVVSSANVPSTAIINNAEKTLGMEELRWCGTQNTSSPDGIEYDNWCNCSASGVFFQQFSTLFAQAAEGLIFYLGYGENPNGTFTNNSFFSLYELPNLDVSVKSVTVMVVHRKGEGESCGEGTLIELNRRFIEKNIAYTCYDVFGDPQDSTQLPALTKCAMGIIDDVQKGSEPDDSSGCFMRGNSAVSGAYLSFFLIAVVALTTLATL